MRNPAAYDPIRYCRPVLLAILICAAFLSKCLASNMSDDLFERYDIVTGNAKRQTMLTGFFLDSAVAELAVVYIDENDDRRMQMHGLEGGVWSLVLDTRLRSEVLFVDVANIGGRGRLITYQNGRLDWFEPESTTARPLAAVTSSFNPPRKDEIPHVDITLDVNHDGRDDLGVPAVDGFWVFIQMSDGTFADPVQIGPPAELAGIYGADGYRYDPWSQSRVFEADFNRDGRRDLVFWNAHRFQVHLQDERGLFSNAARTFTTDVTFDSDDPYSLATGEMTGKVLHSLLDLDGDGVPDLVVFKLEGRRLSRKRSTYEVHRGGPTPDGGTMFAQNVDIAFPSDGVQLGMDRHDFDRDGQVDLMITSIEVKYLKSSLWKRLKAFMGDDIWLDLEFFSMQEGEIRDKPNATRRIQLHDTGSIREPGWVPLDVALRGGLHESRNALGHRGCIPADERCSPHQGTFNAPLLVGDVTGDGRSDLLIGTTPEWLSVFTGVPGQGVFAQQSRSVGVALPKDREYVWLVDLNEDGKQDILLHHPSISEPHRLTILMAR